MAKRYIAFWHGKTQKLEDKVACFCEYDPEKEQYYWDGSLDEFERRLNDKFIVYPDTIAITQYGSWGQR